MISRTVLVVDDHPVNRMLACVLLRDAGRTYAEAADGQEALKKLAEGDFGTVLLDISMPGMSGYEVCEKIRADARLKKIRVIAYTAHALDSERAKIMAAGFDAVLTKPINRQALLNVL